MARPHSRYRFDNGAHAVDLRISNLEQLFDNRDPAPFRQRDLDPDLVDYLIGAAEDLARLGPFRIVLWYAGTAGAADHGIETAFRAHFDYELERIRRARRRQRSIGTLALGVGIVLLAALLTINHLLEGVGGAAGEVVREGLAILSWVVLWRPVETLLYDWLPFRRQYGLMTRLRDAPIEIRAAEPKPASV